MIKLFWDPIGLSYPINMNWDIPLLPKPGKLMDP